jgi:hypothetical protein
LILVSPFLRATAPVMLATHARNLDKDFVGIFELEYALTNTDFVESGFAYLDRATYALCGAGISSCIGVAQASVLGAFQAEGGRPEAAKAAVRKLHRATSSSSNGMAFGQVDVGAMEAEFKTTRFLELFKAERSGVIRYLQRRYRDDAAVASREALKAEASGRLARLRKRNKTTFACAPRGATSRRNLARSRHAAAKLSSKHFFPCMGNEQKAPRRCAATPGCAATSERSRRRA